MARTDVLFVADLDEKGVISKAQNLERGLDNLGKAGEKTDSVFKQLTKSFVVANIVYDGVRRAAHALTDELKSTVKAAIEQENADKALQTALELTGREVDGNTKYFKKYASALQNATVYADDQIQAVQSLLIQMTSLSRDGIDRATRGTIGLASTMRMDLFSAAGLVQKAIEGNFGALSRYGIKVDETLSLEEKRVQLLGKLESMFGRATAETETFEGKVKQLNLAWGDFKEKVGEAITKSGIIQRALENLTTTVKALADAAEPLPAKLSFWERISLGATGTVGAMIQAAATTKKWSNETYVLNEEWRNLQNTVLTGRREAIEPIPEKIEIVVRSMTALKAATVDAAAAFKEMAGANLEYLLRPDYEPEGGPSVIQDLIDAAMEGQKKFKSMEKTWHTTMTRMEYYSDQFFDNITTGFTNAFMNFRLSTEGFRDFFIATWNSIKRAFFQIIGDMLARWAVMSFVKMLFPLQTLVPSFVGGILPGGPVLAQHGYSGVVTQPTMFIAGESAPERVNIQPIGHAGGGERPVSITFNIHAIDASGIEKFLRHDAYPTLRAMFAHGDL